MPFLFLVALSAMAQIRAADYSKISISLGYGRMAGFVFTTWPLIYRQIRLAVFAVIAYATSVVDVALILGPTNPAPLAVRLVDWMNDTDLTMRFLASAGAVIQFALTASGLLIWMLVEKICGFVFRLQVPRGGRFQADKGVRIGSAALMVSIALLVTLGLVILGLWSIAGYWSFPDALPRGFTLKIWERQLTGVERPFQITLILGTVTTLLAVVITLACLEREAEPERQAATRL